MANAPQKLPRGIYEKEPGSKIYWIRYAQFGGKIRREKAGSLANAKRLLTIRHGQKLAGKIPTPEVEKVATKALLFGELIDAAIAYSKAQSSESHAYNIGLALGDVKATFGDRVATEITASEILAWLDAQAKKRSWKPASRNRYQAAISLVYRIAIDDHKLTSNPVSTIKRMSESKEKRTRFLSPEEETSLIAAVKERFPSYVPVVQLAIHTGARRSELFRGRVGDYNPTTGKMTIHQQKSPNAPAERHVPMTPIAVAAYEKLAAGKAEGEFLCTKIDSNYPIETTAYWFDPCVEAAALVNFNWHDLRHTAASRWVMQGVPLAVVAGYLGHSNIQMTMRYSHLQPGNDDRAIAAMMSFYKQ